MIYSIIILLMLLIFAITKIIVDYSHMKNIKEQLEIALENDDHFNIRINGFNKMELSLIEQINKLNTAWKETQIKYIQSSQQSKEMISSITHDFRTPLTSMLGYVQILQDNSDDSEQLRFLKIIEERTNTLTKLVDDFYEVSILDSEEYPVTIQKINPKINVQNQLSMYYEDLSNHFDIIKVDVDDSLVICNSDTKILDRIISNLIKNALNHGVDEFIVKCEIIDDKVIIKFSNKVNANELIDTEKLFERTFRNDLNRNISSTGLGLSIAKELSELVNCNLSVEFNEGLIDFILEIPIVR